MARSWERADGGFSVPFPLHKNVLLETRDDPKALRAYRAAFTNAIRQLHQRGEPARSWPLQSLIHRCAWHLRTLHNEDYGRLQVSA